jgi:hypothetical protein
MRQLVVSFIITRTALHQTKKDEMGGTREVRTEICFENTKEGDDFRYTIVNWSIITKLIEAETSGRGVGSADWEGMGQCWAILN